MVQSNSRERSLCSAFNFGRVYSFLSTKQWDVNLSIGTGSVLIVLPFQKKICQDKGFKTFILLSEGIKDYRNQKDKGVEGFLEVWLIQITEKGHSERHRPIHMKRQ